MNDPIARWAAGRAPELAKRAEAEAVAVLRDALVRAALTGRERERPEPAPSGPVAKSEPGELLWTYCVLHAGDPVPGGLAGVGGSGSVQRLEAAGLAALVSRVPRSEFGEEPLRENLNDLGWLERVAVAHEGVLDRVLAEATIVPLRLCTLYESEEGVRQMLQREHDGLVAALDALAGRQEWGVKVLIDREKLMAAAGSRANLEEPPEAIGGGAYMLRRRAERQLREAADALATEVAGQVHARLEDWALDAVTRPPQNRELSGHEGEMVLNAAYLVEASRAPELRDLVAELETRHHGVGARVELTGPWPPYNFVPGGGIE